MAFERYSEDSLIRSIGEQALRIMELERRAADAERSRDFWIKQYGDAQTKLKEVEDGKV